MADATRFQFTSSSVPGAYDEYLVPRLFAPWAEVLLDAAKVRSGDKVLDVATGPGTVGRAAALRVGTQGHVVGTDISAAMLAIARSKPPAQNSARIEYVESPAAPLRVPSASFDVVVCNKDFSSSQTAGKHSRKCAAPCAPAGAWAWLCGVLLTSARSTPPIIERYAMPV
jgi:ubiquinone/menaquinone biosynthesis C-methylase UbiE